MHRSIRICSFTFAILCAAMTFLSLSRPALAQRHVIEVLADKDSRYKIAGQNKPKITVKAGEALLLRITARQSESANTDGSVHGFALVRARDRSKVPGWDFFLKPGMQEFQVSAPPEPGDYEVICTVICSDDHEGMRMKFVVLP
jgi:heme/copper-type cytochrome/quinol oxidase subunit 2